MRRQLLDKDGMELVQKRLLAEILERSPRLDNLMLVGIERRGADLARRLARALEEAGGGKIPHGSIDINLYRDDWTRLAQDSPEIGKSDIPKSLDGKNIILVDDVLFSGRTVRAALDAIFDYGRPNRVELLVLIDRGHRELPICANYVGRHVETQKDAHVDVLLQERDGEDAVILSGNP